MKILLVNHFPLQGSGSGIYTLNVAEELIKEGNEVYIIDIDNVLDTNRYEYHKKTILCDQKKNKNPDLDFNFPCFTTHPRSNLTYYDLSKKEIKQYVNKYCETVEKVCQDFQPDIIHAQHLWIAPYAASKTGIPYVVTAHGTDLMGFKKDPRYHKYAIKGARRARQVITISHQVNKDVVELYKIPTNKLTLNPNGFSEKIFKVKQVNRNDFLTDHNIKPTKAKIISFVGKFTEFKGIDILIEAIPMINEHVENLIFLLAGDGQLKSEMEQRIKEKNIANCHFLGHLDQPEIASLYNLAELSIVPSRIEPFGLVAIEALACGTPVVATLAGGLPDFINDDVGQLVAMGSPSALSSAIIEEISNCTKKTKGVYAAIYAESNFSWHKTLKKVITVYENAIYNY